MSTSYADATIIIIILQKMNILRRYHIANNLNGAFIE